MSDLLDGLELDDQLDLVLDAAESLEIRLSTVSDLRALDDRDLSADKIAKCHKLIDRFQKITEKKRPDPRRVALLRMRQCITETSK